MEEKRLRAIQNREVKRRMGAMKYYLMPWERERYHASLSGGKVGACSSCVALSVRVPPRVHRLTFRPVFQKKKKKKKRNRGKADTDTLRSQKHLDKKDFGPDGGTAGIDRYDYDSAMHSVNLHRADVCWITVMRAELADGRRSAMQSLVRLAAAAIGRHVESSEGHETSRLVHSYTSISWFRSTQCDCALCCLYFFRFACKSNTSLQRKAPELTDSRKRNTME